MKKIFIISAILFGITLFVWGAYNFAFKNNDANSQASKSVKQASQSEVAMPSSVSPKQEKLTAISKEPVLGVAFDKKTEKLLFYSAVDGTVWQIDSDGSNLIQIVPTKLSGLVGANWSPDRAKVLTTFNKDGKNVFYVYDNVKKIGSKLKDNLDNVVWDGLGGKIIYKYFDIKTKKRSLSVANPDGSGWQTVTDNIPFRNLSIAAVPLSSLVSYWNFPSASDESILQVVAETGGEAKNIFKGKFGGDYLWSPDGSQVLVSSLADRDDKMTTLGIIDLQGNYRDLGIPSLASKCVWSIDGKTIYYALPGNIPNGAVMPDDYQNKKFTTSDTFWRVNVNTGSKERILELADIKGAYDVYMPVLSSTENSLFFTNKTDGKLYRIKL